MADALDNAPPPAEPRPDDVLSGVTVPTFDPVTPEGRRARWALLITSLITLVCLAAAIASEHYLKPWQRYQREYGSLLEARARAADRTPPTFPVEIRQITSTAFGVADRCVTCHVGMDDADSSDAPHPFRSHPAWVTDVHPVGKFGCTPCHGGQGAATKAADAHGRVPHWEDPMIPREYYTAGCGTCHTHLKISGGREVVRGRNLFERNDCFACHIIRGRGTGGGPDLSRIAARKRAEDWHSVHLALQRQSRGDTWWESYGPLEPEEISSINTYLAQLVGNPELIEAKKTFYLKGCLGCHRVNGVGGDDGPDLSSAGRKVPADIDYSRVPGEHNLANWHKAHLRNPVRIVPGSQMPRPDLTEEELDRIVLYLMSLRGTDTDMSRWPPDRVEAVRLGAREFGSDGESLYRAFCSTCHGAEGMGANFGISNRLFPSVAHRELLAIASDRFLRRTLLDGRSGRRMPAWGTKEGGLRSGEIDALIGYLRSRAPAAPSWEEVRAVQPDARMGERLYRNDCASCHGPQGEGAGAPALADPTFLRTVGPEFIYRMLARGREETSMGSYRHYGAREMASVIHHVLSWKPEGAFEMPVLPGRGSPRAGREVFAESCAQCHGESGQGLHASSLTSPALLESASDGMLAAATLRGRCASRGGMPQNLRAPDVTPERLADAIAFLREIAGRGAVQPPGRPAFGDRGRGRELYVQECAGCHGADGRGEEAPDLSHPALQAAATDGYLQAAILRGRPPTGMPAFGSDNPNHRKLDLYDVGDIVRYLRTLHKGK